jgi:hypothetical protein
MLATILVASLELVLGAMPGSIDALNELQLPPTDCVFTVGANSYDLSGLPAFATAKDSRCTAVPPDTLNCYDYQMSVCHPVASTTCPAYNQKGMMLQFKTGRCMSYIGSAGPGTVVATLLPMNLDPTEQTDPAPLTPTATQPAEKGFQVAFKQGLGPCKGSPDARTVRYQFLCDPSAGTGQPVQVYESLAASRCDYTAQWSTSFACPGGGGGAGGGLFGGHGTMLTVVFFLCAAAYFGGGTYYRVTKAGIPLGVEAVPNIDFWRELPSLVKDGIQFTVAKTKWFVQMVTSKYEEVK